MGHKVHPKAFRLAVTKAWDATWFAQKDAFRTQLREDVKIRAFLKKALKEALVDRIEIERSRGNIAVNVHSAKPGVIIGRGGAGIEELTKKLKGEFFRGRKVNLSINVKEIAHPSLSASVVGQQIVSDIEKRMPFRRTMKMAIERVLKSGAEGVKITIGGRLNGAEIARVETLASGKIPLHNLRADIDFARETAYTIYGAIGVKVWINRGEKFQREQDAKTA
ncbi:30S ribosomal protein S3 [Candidatus Uhrbacteria bacterium RIFCSPHIGHO2_01_FULL_63_20]|uniref:Small ribosomal subunit protein uS3 n=1 Tax=Candidatus Uhrbacteria bacterium RIFCSPHIGHO2_01_FULL_63_20 TaxID=1802385 RepID=A0A1F7TMG7_9BACT|nr:MAG: 30S ribosomal protein S3 [Candidatus Uhrbacteria bacterium RIFCSPHIGHO2_01_FULL_63_20]